MRKNNKNKGSRFEEESEGARISFNPKNFLAKVGDGKTVAQYQKDQIVFAQGDAAEAVFCIQKGRVKLTVVSEQGKEAVLGIPETGHFFVRDVSMAIHCASRQLRQSLNAGLRVSPSRP
jgi:CRP-like cAMP-binding protein